MFGGEALYFHFLTVSLSLRKTSDESEVVTFTRDEASGEARIATAVSAGTLRGPGLVFNLIWDRQFLHLRARGTTLFYLYVVREQRVKYSSRMVDG